MNDYEAHLSSYDHSHKQRMKDMKAMVRDPNAGARARRAEAKADGLVAIKMPEKDGGGGGASAAGGGGGGFKKGGFKKSGFKSTMVPAEGQSIAPSAAAAAVRKPSDDVETMPSAIVRKTLDGESDTEDEGYDVYDPRYPTD